MKILSSRERGRVSVDHFEHYNFPPTSAADCTLDISGIVEYVKLLRQNIQLRNGDESVIEEVDQATCAANATEAPGVTGSMANDSIGNHTSESTTGGSAPLPAGTPPSQAQPRPLVPNLTTPAAMAYYDMPMPQLPFPLHQKPFQAPRHLPRRRLYNEPPVVGLLQRNKVPPLYYKKTLPKGSDFRRFDYDNDPFNDTPTTVCEYYIMVTAKSNLYQLKMVLKITIIKENFGDMVFKPFRSNFYKITDEMYLYLDLNTFMIEATITAPPYLNIAAPDDAPPLFCKL
ncbi:hypothetical protein MSG28_000978 [Choristoneura fumiferana]|uniref:Uncharacterized protein n=1 Tax=Choristoneura fumiferana TaxID=7141 RepID=A0ACC0K3P1_CHOFU|nr:hypothetical protein MSG28_000978 [Choristoneura fumiferana]